MTIGPVVRRAALGIAVAVSVLPLVPLLVWSVSGQWRYPGLVPQHWSTRGLRLLTDPHAQALQGLATSTLIAPPVAAGSVLVFAFAFGSYEVPYLLGRPYPATLPVVAYQYYRDTDLTLRPQAMAVAVLITALSVLSVAGYLALVRRLSRRALCPAAPRCGAVLWWSRPRWRCWPARSGCRPAGRSACTASGAEHWCVSCCSRRSSCPAWR